ncbi:MAG: hypothetical protein QXX95_00975 [Nitrososphaerales archaeon]
MPNSRGEEDVDLKTLVQATLTSIFIWLSVIHLPNGVGIYALVRGSGLVHYTIDICILTPEVDLYLWLLLLAAVALLSLRLLKRGFLEKAAFTLLLFSAPLNITSSAALILAIAAGVLTLYNLASKGGASSKRHILSLAAVIWLTLTASITLPSALRWLLNGFDGSKPFTDFSWAPSFTELQLANSLQPIAPRLFLIFTSMWLLRVALWRKTFNIESNKVFNRGCRAKLTLAASLILAVYVGLYPYLPALNPSSTLVGVDTHYYYTQMKFYVNLDVRSILSEASRSDRALYLLLQQSIASLLGIEIAARATPAILIASLTISTYYLSSTHRRDLALLAALYTPISFQAVAGINAGFYANLLALVEVNFALALYIKTLKGGGKRPLLGASALSVAALYTHPATWLIFIATITLTSVITWLRRSLTLTEAKTTVTLIAVNLVGEAVKNLLIRNPTTFQTAQTMTPHISAANILSAIQNLNTTFTTFLGDAYSNPLILILATIGLFYIAASRNRLHTTLLALTIVCTTGALFTESTLPSLLQSRFIYLTPFQILAAYGTQTITSLLSKWLGECRLSRVATVTLHIPIISSLISYTLREVGFIYVAA